jgi:hypothetical protein
MRKEIDAGAFKRRIDRSVLRPGGSGQEQQQEERDVYAQQRHSQPAPAIAIRINSLKTSEKRIMPNSAGFIYRRRDD